MQNCAKRILEDYKLTSNILRRKTKEYDTIYQFCFLVQHLFANHFPKFRDPFSSLATLRPSGDCATSTTASMSIPLSQTSVKTSLM